MEKNAIGVSIRALNAQAPRKERRREKGVRVKGNVGEQ